MAKLKNPIVFARLGEMRAFVRLSATELAHISKTSRTSVQKAEQGLPVSKIIALKILDGLLEAAREREISEQSDMLTLIRNTIDSLREEYKIFAETKLPLALIKIRQDIDVFKDAGGFHRLTINERSEFQQYFSDIARHISSFSELRPMFDGQTSEEDENERLLFKGIVKPD